MAAVWVDMCAVVMRVELEAIAKVQSVVPRASVGGESGGDGQPMGVRGDAGTSSYPGRRCRARLNFKKITLLYSAYFV
jgi:hypothetical protein